MIRKAVTGAAAVVLGLGLALAGVSPASAAYVRPAQPPGAGVSWGVPVAQLSATCNPGTGDMVAAGGWSTRTFVSETWGPGTTASPTAPPRPITAQLGEPCYTSGAASGYKIGFGGTTSQLAYGVPGGSVSAVVDLGRSAYTTVSDGWLRCAATEWSTTSSINYISSGGRAVNANWNDTRLSWGGNYFNFPGTCNYLISAHLPVCTYGADWITDNSDYRCSITTWSAENWYNNKAYKASEGGTTADAQKLICLAIGGTHSDCVFLGGSDIDGADFDQVCAYAPEFTFGDWNWLKAAIGHYARCLWQPVNGFDKTGIVADSVAASPIAALTGPVTTALEAWQISGSCGSIFNTGSGTPLPGFGFSTCGMEWGNIIRDIAGIGVLVFGGFYVLRSIAKTALTVLSRSAPPTPVPDGDKK